MFATQFTRRKENMRYKNNTSVDIKIGLPKIIFEPENCHCKPVFLDTLAQPVLPSQCKPKVGALETLRKRAVAKYYTERILFPLIDLPSELNKRYWQTYHCVRTLLQDDTKITGKYCNQRWCFVCSRIRAGKLLNGYSKQLQALDDLRFATLTLKNVPGKDLANTLDTMVNTVIAIQKQFRRHKNCRIVGIRKLEITYNVQTDEYHPHIHFIVSGIQVAASLIDEWLKRIPEANRGAQDNRPCTDLIEAFKYACKVYKSYQRGDKKIIEVYPAHALDTMFKALVGRRIIQPMGGLRMVNEDLNDLASTVNVANSRTEIWQWEQESCDWVNAEYECLAGGAIPEVEFVDAGLQLKKC